MAGKTRTKSHSFHPAVKTVGSVCFTCASQLLSKTNRTPLWQLSLLLEDLLQVFYDHEQDFKKMVCGEPRPWLTQFLQALFDLGLMSTESIQDKTLKILEALINFNESDPCVRKTAAKWISVNANRVNCSLILHVVRLLLNGNSPSDYLNLQGDFALSSVVKGLRQDSAKVAALDCLSLLTELSSVSSVHGPVLLAELLGLVEKDCKHQRKAAELLLSLTNRCLPRSINWLADIKGVEASFKKILLSKSTETAVFICRTISILVENDARSSSLLNSLLKSEILDVLCNSLCTQDAEYMASAMHTIHHFCRSSRHIGEVPAKYYTECLFRSCQHIAPGDASNLLEEAVESIQLLLERGKVKFSRSLELIAMNTLESSFRVLKLTDKAILSTMQLYCYILKQKLFGASCTPVLINIVCQLTHKLSLLPMLKAEEVRAQQLFITFTELLQHSLDYSSPAVSAGALVSTPEQQAELSAAVISAIDSTLMRLFQQILTVSESSAEPVQRVFSLLLAVAKTTAAGAGCLLDKFTNSGGIALCIELKHWDQQDGLCYVSPFLQFLAHRVCSLEHEPLNLTTEAIALVPDNLPAMVSELFTPSNRDSLSTCIDLLYAISLSDIPNTCDMCETMVRSAAGRYDAEMVRGLSVCQQIRFAKLLSTCWHTMQTGGTMEFLQTEVLDHELKQGLARFLIDNINQKVKTSAVTVSLDVQMMNWVADMGCSNTPLSRHLLLQSCDRLSDNAESGGEISSCLARNLPLLDVFVGMMVDRKVVIPKAMQLVEGVRCVAERLQVETLPSICDVLEMGLCELAISACDEELEADKLLPLKGLVNILQMGSKVTIGSALSRLLHRVLEKISDWFSEKEVVVICGNFLITMLYHSLTAHDCTVAAMIIDNTDVQTFIINNINVEDELLLLMVTDLFVLVIACATTLAVALPEMYKLPACLLLETFDNSNIIHKIVYLQVWYTHFKYSLLTERSFLKWHSPDVNGLDGFDETQLQAMYFCLQQDMCSPIPLIMHAARKVVPALQAYINKFIPRLSVYVEQQAWNDVVLSLDKSSKAMSQGNSCDAQNISPFIHFQDIVLVLLTETEILEQS